MMFFYIIYIFIPKKIILLHYNTIYNYVYDYVYNYVYNVLYNYDIDLKMSFNNDFFYIKFKMGLL